eukprot:CAMPEP_0198649840 /NCGR_PEP_ID=MMETSP1467-20131203/4556_1 /TAXON_ID=1462469 /ORGANISM="unid. sp., Strain CCMP2135" /LENGTH=287 /DNA_ID=CAMNT_0044385647 /DNA_START=14 /DNA_END=877 /DNA_ORIENTATION=+
MAVQLYNGLTGEAKREGDAPLGIGYDEDGIPHPDWRVEVEGLEPDPKTGRRRGAKIVGAIDLKDLAGTVTRHPPTWGKKFGRTTVEGVGDVGALTVEEAVLCLTTEDFGFRLGADADKAPYKAPYVRLCYGELHGEQASIRYFVGLSELHLLKDLDLRECHYALQRLGYVCYNSPENLDEERWWGPGINACPHKVTAGVPGGKGPAFYSWYYRLPPWMPGLVLEGEDADYLNGPLALKLKARHEHRHMHAQKTQEDGLANLADKAKDQREDWLTTALVAPDYDQDKE